MNIPDNYDQWEAHDREQAKRLAQLPKCDICDHPIQDDHYYEINGDHICPGCLNDHFRKEIEI